MLRDPWSLDPQDFMIIRSALHIVLAAMVLAPAAAAQSNPSGGSVVAFRVGDAIRVQVWRNPELSGTYEIGEDGTVLHPLYRSIRVAGLSLPEAEDEFRQLLQRFEQEPEFVIEPVFRIGIGGEVRSPNVYTVTALTTVMQAAAQAGGTGRRWRSTSRGRTRWARTGACVRETRSSWSLGAMSGAACSARRCRPSVRQHLSRTSSFA
jgi:protein involved in polysaccharide export with SLBB domain